MKHIRKFNESTEKLYKEIDEDDLSVIGIYLYKDEPARLETISKIWADFTRKELDIIKKYTPLNVRKHIVCPIGQTDKHFIEIKSSKPNIYLSIVKIIDDWFFVTVGAYIEDNYSLTQFVPGSEEEDIFFKCDSIEGLEQLLKDFNWFRL